MTQPAHPSPDEVELAHLASAGVVRGVRWHEAVVDDSGQFHRVLLAPNGQLVCRITRTQEAGVAHSHRQSASELLARRVALVEQLAVRGLPWQLPRAVGAVVHAHGRAAVVQLHVDGWPHPFGTGDPTVLREICASLAHVDTGGLDDLLAGPFWFRGPWTPERVQTLITVDHDDLPRDWHDLVPRVGELVTRWTTAGEVAPSLVHGDLGGHNMRWLEGDHGRRLNGVLDWDNTCLWDPAVNLAQLSLWHGPEIVADAARSPDEAARARVWVAAMGLEALEDAQCRVRAGEAVKLTRLVRKATRRLEDARPHL